MIFVVNHARHFRNDVAAALDFDPVANLYPQALYLIHVVQRGAADSGAANGYRLELRNRRQLSCAPYLYMNLLDLRDSASRCVFVSDCPARGFAGESELPLQRNAVDLDHHAVDLIRQRLAFFFPLTDKLPRLVEVVRQSAARVHFETSNFESVQRLPMISEDGAAIRDEHVGKVVQPTLCGNTRLKLPHG